MLTISFCCTNNASSNHTKAINGGRSYSGTNCPCSIIGRSKVAYNTGEFGIGVDNRIRRLNLLNRHAINKVNGELESSIHNVYLESGVCVSDSIPKGPLCPIFVFLLAETKPSQMTSTDWLAALLLLPH